MELDSFMEGTDLAEILVAQEFCVIDGKTLALSNYAWGTTGIFYRKSMFDAAGIDRHLSKPGMILLRLQQNSQPAIKRQWGF